MANSEQHVELGVLWRNRYVSDLSKIQAGSESIVRHYLQGFAMMVQSIVTTMRKLERKFINNFIMSTSMMQRPNEDLK